MKKYIIFDADRTLVDSCDAVIFSLQEAIENVLGIKIEESELKRLTSLPSNQYLKSLNIKDDNIDLINKKWAQTYQKYETKCFKGLKEIIKDLSNKGYVIGIITSRDTEEYHELDSELEDIKDYIKIVVTSDLVELPKPSSDSMTYLCNKMNCSSDEVIYIGDSKSDMEFAKNSHCSFIPACWENNELINVENACFNTLDIVSLIEKDAY
ncbi:MAG: HAD-IA family hydrolase [Bacilli bacterium]|nr:HAD-IA family hydrolase [Bacilli bacterium]